MVRSKGWVRTNFENLKLQIGDFEFRVAQYTGTFALNEVPRATCTLAIGRKTDGSNERAEIHKAAFQLKAMEKATVLWTPKGDFDENGNEWPNEEAVLFSGYLAGFSYRKVKNQMHAVVQLVHWLSDLGFSSAAIRSAIPSNAMEGVFSAAIEQLTTGAGSSGKKPVNLADYQLAPVAGSLTRDLWTAIKDVFCGVATRDLTYNLGPDATCIAGVANEKNTEAQNALLLMEDGGAEGCTFEGDINGNSDKLSVPLAFDPQLPVTFTKGVIRSLGQDLFKSYMYTSFWDKLIGEFATKFMFAVVPLVGRSLVVPWQPGSREVWTKQLKPNEYVFVDFNANLPRPLQSVNVVGSFPSSTMVPHFENPEQPQPQQIIGCYKPKDDEESNRGVSHFVQAPQWLMEPIMAGAYVGGTTGVKDQSPQPTATQPDATNSGPEDPGPEDLRTQSEALFDSYAQALYVRESARGRMGSITGKLRFDIAPGSTVRLEQTAEQFVGAVFDELATPLVGHVIRMTVNINSESRQATTSYKLAFMRTEQENSDDRFSTPKHPLYSDAFAGAPLIPEYEFSD